MLWSRNATANVATSIVAGDCVRSGRKTTRSIASDSASTTAKQQRGSRAHSGPVPLGGEGERVRAGHDQLAVREVDEPQDAEDEADADRHQRVDAPRPIASTSTCGRRVRRKSVSRWRGSGHER